MCPLLPTLFPHLLPFSLMPPSYSMLHWICNGGLSKASSLPSLFCFPWRQSHEYACSSSAPRNNASLPSNSSFRLLLNWDYTLKMRAHLLICAHLPYFVSHGVNLQHISFPMADCCSLNKASISLWRRCSGIRRERNNVHICLLNLIEG